MTAVTCLSLPGLSGSYASAPDTAALSIISDIDVRARVALDDWTPAAAQIVVSKWTASGSQKSWQLYVDTTGALTALLSSDGASISGSAASSVAPTISDGAILWIRFTFRDSDNRFQFFTAPGTLTTPVAADFTQLGTDFTSAAAGIFDSTAVLNIGSANAGAANLLAGKVYRVQIRNGIDGTLVFDSDFTTVVKTAGSAPTTMVEGSANAATVTINGAPQWDWFDGWAVIYTGANVATVTDATSYATASWTPRPNRLYLAWVQIGAATTVVSPSVTGNSMTWTVVAESLSGTQGCSLVAALSGSAPTAGATTFDYAGVTQNGSTIEIIEVDGADLSGTALTAIAQSATGSSASQATPFSFSFTNAPATGNRCLLGIAITVNDPITQRANWTELSDLGHNTPAYRLETQWRGDASEQTVSASAWTGTPVVRAVAVEVRQSNKALTFAPPRTRRALQRNAA